MVTAVINRLRIRPIRLIWYRCNFLKGFGWSSALFFVMLSVIMYAGFVENRLYLYLGVGYLMGGLCWLIAARLSTAIIITDFAVIKNTSKKGSVLGWNQVTDFFVHQKGDISHYVFLYEKKDRTRGRFELSVPPASLALFKKVIHNSVENKVLPTRQRAYG